MLYNFFGGNMKKIKKKITILLGTMIAGIIGVGGLRWLNDIIKEPVAMYGVPMSSQHEMENFNAKFNSYTGNNIEGTIIRQLYNTINHSNATYERVIEYIGPNIIEIRPSRKYNVEIEYNEEGYVCKVIVTENEKINKDKNEMNNI